MTRLKASWMLCVLLVGVATTIAQGAPTLEKPGADLMLEGLDDLLEPPAQPGESSKPGARPSPRPTQWAPNEKMLNDMIDRNLQGQPATPELGEDLGQPSGASLEGIEESMNQATRLIGGTRAAGETAQVQQKIVSDLDELIKKMEKQCSNCNNSSSSSSSSRQQSQRSKPKPSQQSQSQSQSQSQPQQSQASSAARESTTRLGQADGKPQPGRQPDELMKEVWGHLPQRVREQMLQSSSDEFLPQYREQIEAYFKRLAEEEANRGGGN